MLGSKFARAPRKNAATAQTVGAQLDPEWQILAGHVAFLVVLVIRPRGLFPRAVD